MSDKEEPERENIEDKIKEKKHIADTNPQSAASLGPMESGGVTIKEDAIKTTLIDAETSQLSKLSDNKEEEIKADAPKEDGLKAEGGINDMKTDEKGKISKKRWSPMALYKKIETIYQNWKEKIVDLANEEEKEEEQIYGKGWDRLGYHKTIGRFLYTIGLLIPSSILGLLLLPLLKYTVYADPTIMSYEAAAGALFGALYTILDLELQPAIDRFVPQYAITNPEKAMQYATFFIKYQMWSGILQIAFVSAYVFLYIIPYSHYAYLAWFILFINIKQYPAILSTFASLISTLQYGDKEKLITFFRADVIEPITKLGMGLVGLWYGTNHPEVGAYVGIAFGWMVGAYMDDFFTWLLGMYWLSKIIHKYLNTDGEPLRIRDLYGQKVPKEVWKSALGYSMRLWPKSFMGAIMGLFNFLINYKGLPGYMSYSTLIKESENLRRVVGWSDDILNGSGPILAESFNNGKIELTRYYIGQGLRYYMMFFMILGSFTIFALPLLVNVVLIVVLNQSWGLIAQIVPIMVVLWMWSPYDDITNKMVYLSKHPEVNTILDIVGAFVNLFFSWYFLFVLKMGWLGMVLAQVPNSLMHLIVRWIYMQKKIIKLDKNFWKDFAWTIFIAPILAGTLFIIYLLLSIKFLWPVLANPFSEDAILIPAIIFLAITIFGGLFGIYLPALAFFGFWDERSLTEFKRAVAVSGPSLPIVWIFYRIFKAFHKRSPFKKYGYVKLGEIAEQQLKELSLIRYQNLVKNNTNNNS
ncbi:MAG: hypothetical protein ACTSU2_10580 [Promethearchaeota archaeon]